MSLRASGIIVTKIAPRILPKVEPIPPTMMAVKKKMDMLKGKL